MHKPDTPPHYETQSQYIAWLKAQKAEEKAQSEASINEEAEKDLLDYLDYHTKQGWESLNERQIAKLRKRFRESLITKRRMDEVHSPAFIKQHNVDYVPDNLAVEETRSARKLNRTKRGIKDNTAGFPTPSMGPGFLPKEKGELSPDFLTHQNLEESHGDYGLDSGIPLTPATIKNQNRVEQNTNGPDIDDEDSNPEDLYDGWDNEEETGANPNHRPLYITADGEKMSARDASRFLDDRPEWEKELRVNSVDEKEEEDPNFYFDPTGLYENEEPDDSDFDPNINPLAASTAKKNDNTKPYDDLYHLPSHAPMRPHTSSETRKEMGISKGGQKRTPKKFRPSKSRNSVGFNHARQTKEQAGKNLEGVLSGRSPR